MTHPSAYMSPFLGGRIELDLLAGVLAGLASSLHCAAMCGGVAGFVAARGRGGLAARAGRLAQAQGGRILVYLAMGAVAGGFGGAVSAGFGVAGGEGLHAVMRFAAAAALLSMAAVMSGLAPAGASALAGRLASPLTRRLGRLHRFGPAATGLAWGLMPCAMVYMTTVYAGFTGSVFGGAQVMLGFGLGTAPAVFAAGLAGGLAAGARDRPGLRYAGAALLSVMAVISAAGPGLTAAMAAPH